MSFKSTALFIAFLTLAALILLGAHPAPPAPPAPPQPKEDRVFFFSAGGAWLGVQLSDITAERARALGLKEEMGAEIKGILPDSPAEAAGLKEGDVILEYQGTRVLGVAQLTRMVQETPAGRTVKLQIVRDKAPREVSVKMSEREAIMPPGHRFRMPHFEMRDFDVEVPEFDVQGMFGQPFGPGVFRLGAQVEDVGEQLGAFFGVKNGEGVLVRSVRKGTPGDTAGLKAGDVIVRVDDEKVADHADLRTALRDRRRKPFDLTIVRDRRETTLKIAAPKAADRSTDDGDDEEDGDSDGADAGHDTKQIRKEVKRIKAEVRKTLDEGFGVPTEADGSL